MTYKDLPHELFDKDGKGPYFVHAFIEEAKGDERVEVKGELAKGILERAIEHAGAVGGEKLVKSWIQQYYFSQVAYSPEVLASHEEFIADMRAWHEKMGLKNGV